MIRERWRLYITGIVQGVGFRPFVWRLATGLNLSGFVRNDTQGVIVEAEGEREALRVFLRRLKTDAPPLAIIDDIIVSRGRPKGEGGFRIVESQGARERLVLISPDVATCPDCLRELFDPKDRRYLYPFLNCTNCGPRFTIIKDVPYDRERTTMEAFPMCPECSREYHDPNDRRFHAQPTACPQCGPRAVLTDAEGNLIPCDDPIREAARRICQGEIIAVKGLGGYHLVCDAADEKAVLRLREGKKRDFKPFALMVPDLETARRLVKLTPEAETLLTSWRRPILILPRRDDVKVAPSVSPGLHDLGIMLPYTPLHHLLLSAVKRSVVMTSGNISDEPIAYEDEDARKRLGKMVDAFLTHDRKIHIRCDDSVVRFVEGVGEIIIRRSRGYAPQPLLLPFPSPEPLLAVGPMLKNTFALVRDRYAFVSHHIGDLDHYAAFQAFLEGIKHFRRLFGIEPQAVAYDLHPDYPSTHYALGQEGVKLIGVQHHHAHAVAVMAEHGLEEPVIGVTYDGTGYGIDGTIWGGEILIARYKDFERVGFWEPVVMPGGEKATRQAWRMAGAWLKEAFGDEGEKIPIGIAERVGRERWRDLWRLLRSDLPQPITTSLGRVFDAVSSLLGICDISGYEGHAAVCLEMTARQGMREGEIYPLELGGDGPIVVKVVPIIRALVADLLGGTPVPQIAAKFHDTVVEATVKVCDRIRGQKGIMSVVLSGGVMQNRWILQKLFRRLKEKGFSVYVPHKLPPNDGGICYGQAAVAARVLGEGTKG